MRGQPRHARDARRNALADGPRQAESVVSRRSASELVDDDERVARGRLNAAPGRGRRASATTPAQTRVECRKGRPRTRRIVALSSISAMNVDTPLSWLSPAPTRASMQSKIGTVASSAGTKQPIWAMSAMTPIWRMYVDLPPAGRTEEEVQAISHRKRRGCSKGETPNAPMLGPVMMMNSAEPRTSSTSFGMNVMSSCASRHGWREALSTQSPPPFSSTLGLTYGIGALTEMSAKLAEGEGGHAVRGVSYSAVAYPAVRKDTHPTRTSSLAMSESRFSSTGM